MLPGYFTFDPVIVFLVSMEMVVKAVVSVAVKIDTIHIPIRIQHTANARPKNDRGERSPYLNIPTSHLSRRIDRGGSVDLQKQVFVNEMYEAD